ncbi:MAG: class I SAM-dependent methyltransferase [Clostridia bacterium]|nr:class I SAM-dependent methyltransferase [Clostridia bacterium]
MYGGFASIYDRLIDVDYKKIADFYEKVFEKYGQKPHLMLDLGCGTGTLTHMLHKRGYDMIGVDASEEMLMRAKEKDGDILYLCQSMTDFELYGTVGAAVSCLDCANYLLEEDELFKMLSLINNYLDPKALFIFDISSFKKLSETLGNNTFIFEEDNIFYTWENSFEGNILDMRLNFFEKDGNLYKRSEEEQTQRAYSIDEILKNAEKAGLICEDVFDGFSLNKANDDSERLVFVMRECGK